MSWSTRVPSPVRRSSFVCNWSAACVTGGSGRDGCRLARDPAEQDKAKRASDILAGRDLALSVQVLQEFYVQATRASRPDAIGHQQAVLLIESFRRFRVQDITSAIMMAALDARQR